MILEAFFFILTALSATAVVLTREPKLQTIVLSYYGLILSILFIVLQSPDVAFSEIVVGTVITPAMILIAISKIGRRSQ